MMFRRKRGWVGIEFGARALKMAQVDRAGSDLRIAHAAILWRSPGGGGPAPQRLEWTSEDIAAALALDHGFRGRRVACVLPMECSDLHALSIPEGTPEERRAMVAGELENIYASDGVPREFAFWDCPPSSGQGTAPKENTQVLAASRELVSQVVQWLGKARLACQVMDGLPFTLARAASLAFPARGERPVGVIDWGYSTGTFCVASGDKPRYTRPLRKCGVGLLVEAVGSALELSEDESIELLTGSGVRDAAAGTPPQHQIADILAEIARPVLQSLAGEIQKTISYLRMQYPDLVPDWLCLVGDGAAVQEVAGTLSEKVGLPVRLWRSAQEDVPSADPHRPPEPLLAVAAALSALAWLS